MLIPKEGSRWFAAIMAGIDHVQPPRTDRPAIGVDLGVSDLATLSKIAGPKALRSHLRKLAKLQCPLNLLG